MCPRWGTSVEEEIALQNQMVTRVIETAFKF